MTAFTLSVVIPAYNAKQEIGETIGALVVALERAHDFEAELIVVDDGSTDATADAATRACPDHVPLRVVRQANQGRFLARRAGLEIATGEWVLLLDSRVVLEPDALRFVALQLDHGSEVWNGHVHVIAGDNPFGIFWKLLAEFAWPSYFDDPRDTSYGIDEFDLFPKGTTCFLARRKMLDEAVAAFRTRYTSVCSANDDTPLIRWIAERARIHLSPRFCCSYQPRTSLTSFARHAVHRGIVFLDGHADPSSRYFPGILAFYPSSALLVWIALRRPAVAPAAAVGVGVAAAAFAARRSRSASEQRAMFVAAPIYAAGHAAGMWKGLAMLALGKISR